MGDIADVLAFKLQSKICYHRDANLDYLEIKAMVDKLVEENKKFRDEKMQYLDMINTFIEEKENLQHDYDVIKEQVTPMEEQLETVKKELTEANKKLVAAKHEHVVAKEELVVTKNQLARKTEELEVSRKKLQKSEAMHTQIQQKKRSAPAPEPVHFRRVTRSAHEHVVAKEELVVAKEKLAQKNKELEVLRKKLQECEANHSRLRQHKRSAPGP